MRSACFGVRGFSKGNRQKGYSIVQISSADLYFCSAVGRFATDDGPADRICGGFWLAGVAQEDKTFHQLRTRSYCQSRKRFCVAGSEKFLEGDFIARTCSDKNVSKCRSWAGHRRSRRLHFASTRA